MVRTPQATSASSSSLQPNAVSLRHVWGDGLLSNGPLASVTVTVTGAVAYGLGATPLVFIIGAILALAYINGVYQFSRHIQSAGGVYNFARAGLGPNLGFGSAVAYIVGNIVFVAANALTVATLIEYTLSTVHVTLPGWAATLIGLAGLAIPLYACYIRVKPALNYGIVTASIEIIIVVAVAIYFIVHAGSNNTTAVFHPALAKNGWAGVAVGMAVAAIAMSGADSTVALGEESKEAYKTIKRGALGSQVSVVLLYILIGYGLTVAWGPHLMSSFATSSSPFLMLLSRTVGMWLVWVVTILAVNSLIGVNVATIISLSRMIFDAGRLGTAPGVFTAIHKKHRTPTAALVVIAVIALFLMFVPKAIWGQTTAFIVIVVGGVAGVVLSQILTNVSLIIYSRRRRLKGVFGYYIIPAVAAVALGYALYANVVPLAFPNSLGLIVMGCLFIVAVPWAAMRTRQIRARAPMLAAAETSDRVSPDEGPGSRDS
jgi:amino acid transporter